MPRMLLLQSTNGKGLKSGGDRAICRRLSDAGLSAIPIARLTWVFI